MVKSAKRKHDEVSGTPTAAPASHAAPSPKAAEVISSGDKPGQKQDGAAKKKQKGVKVKVMFKHGISGVEQVSKIDTSQDLGDTSIRVAAKLRFPPDADVRLVQVRDGGREAEIWDDFDFDAFRKRALANPSQCLTVKVYPAAGPSTFTGTVYSPSAYRTPQSQPAPRPALHPGTPTPASQPAASNSNTPRTPSNSQGNSNAHSASKVTSALRDVDNTPKASVSSPSEKSVKNRKMRRLEAQNSLTEEGLLGGNPTLSPRTNALSQSGSEQNRPKPASPAESSRMVDTPLSSTSHIGQVPPSSTKKNKAKKQRRKRLDQQPTPLSSPSIAKITPAPPAINSTGKRKRSASPAHVPPPLTTDALGPSTSDATADTTISEQPKKKKQKKKKDKSLPNPENDPAPTPSPGKSIPPQTALPPTKTGRQSLSSKTQYQPARPSPLGQFSTSAVNDSTAAPSGKASAEVAPVPPSAPSTTDTVTPTSEIPAIVKKPKKQAKKQRASLTATATDLPSSSVPAIPQVPDVPIVESPKQVPASLEDIVQMSKATSSASPSPIVITKRPVKAKPRTKSVSQREALAKSVMAEFRAYQAAQQAKEASNATGTGSRSVQADMDQITTRDESVARVNSSGQNEGTSGSAPIPDTTPTVSKPVDIDSTPRAKGKGKKQADTAGVETAASVIPAKVGLEDPATPGNATQRGKKTVVENGTGEKVAKGKKGKAKGVLNTMDSPAPDAASEPVVKVGRPMETSTPPVKKARRKKEATMSTPDKVTIIDTSGVASNTETSVSAITQPSKGVQAPVTIELPVPALAETPWENPVEPTTTAEISESLSNPANGVVESATTHQIPVTGKKPKNKKKTGEETAQPAVDISTVLPPPANLETDRPIPPAEPDPDSELEPITADTAEPATLADASVQIRGGPDQTTHQLTPSTTDVLIPTPVKTTTTRNSQRQTFSTEAVPLIIPPISTSTPSSSTKPVKKASAKAPKYVKPPPFPRGESFGPEKPTCLICGVVVSHMQKDCPVVIAGLEALEDRLQVVKTTPKSRDRKLALEMIGGWVKRLQIIRKRREEAEAAKTNPEPEGEDEENQEDAEEDAGSEEDEMFAPPSPPAPEHTQPEVIHSPVQRVAVIADEEEAMNASNIDITPHPPMMHEESKSSPIAEYAPLVDTTALAPSPGPAVSARPRSESSSSSSTSSTSSRSSVDSSEAIKTPSTAQPVSADPPLPAIFLKGFKKHHRPGSTGAVSASTALIETEDSDSASGSDAESSEEQDQDQDLASELDRSGDDDNDEDGEADEANDGEDGAAFGGAASSVIGASAIADSVLDEDDDMDGDDEADDISQTTSRIIGRLALPRRTLASKGENPLSNLPINPPADLARVPSPDKASMLPKPTPSLDTASEDSESDDSDGDTSSPQSSLLPYVPSPTLHPSASPPEVTAEMPDAETMFKQFFSRPLSQRERAEIKAASQGQKSISLRPDVEEGEEDEEDVQSASEAPAYVGGDDASSIGDFGSIAGGDGIVDHRDDSADAEEGAAREIQQPIVARANDIEEKEGRESGEEEEEEVSEQEELDVEDGEGDEDDEIRSDRTSVPPEQNGSVPEVDSANNATVSKDAIESDSPDDSMTGDNATNGFATDSILIIPLSQADDSLPSQQTSKSRRSASERSSNETTYTRRSARFKQLDDKGGESEAVDEFAGSVAFAEARAEEATPEPLSLGSLSNGVSLPIADDTVFTPKAGRKIARSVSSSQPMAEDSQDADAPNGNLPNGSLTRRRSSRLRSTEVEVIIPVPQSRARRASSHSQASQNGTSASQRTPKASLGILVEDSDELAQNVTPRGARSSQVDQLDSSQPLQAQSQLKTPPPTQKDKTIPATPTSRKVTKVLPPSSPATSARSTRSTSRSHAQSPLFMSQSQPLATQAYIARPQSLASSSPSLVTPARKPAGKKGKKGGKGISSPIVEEEEDEEDADAELETPRRKSKVNGKLEKDPLSSPSPPADPVPEPEQSEEVEEEEYFSQVDPSPNLDHEADIASGRDGGVVDPEAAEEADDGDESENDEDEAASSIALPPILSRPIVPSSQAPAPSQASFAPSLSSLPMDLLRSGVTAFAAFTGLGSQPIPRGPNGSSQSLIRDLDMNGNRHGEGESDSDSASGESSSDDDDDKRGGREVVGGQKRGKEGLKGRYVQTEKEKQAAKKKKARPIGW